MHKIAIIIERSRAYGRALIEGVVAYAQESCSWILRPMMQDEVDVEKLREFDGIIARVANDGFAEKILKSGRPAVDVFCQKQYEGIAGIDSNHYLIGKMAREFFRARGFKNIAYCGMPGVTFSDERERAFLDDGIMTYTSRKKVRFIQSHFYNERFERIPDKRSLAAWLKRLPKPIAIFCCNDLRAIQLQRVASGLGLRIPNDVSVLGVDNDTIACSFADVPLSSIDPNAFMVGRSAARILSSMIANPPEKREHPVQRVNPGNVVERTSTEFVPINPPWLGEALIYIERNMDKQITASDIFALAKRSSTFVENVFHEKLGMPVQSYVNSVKLREAKRLMFETEMRISEISVACGFASPAYFCRAFSHAFGKSPRAFRNSTR